MHEPMPVMMRSPPTRLLLLAVVVTVAACASAGKRLKQGAEAEARGDYVEAASRYIDALEKDATLSEAREALLAAWDSALASGLRDAARWADRSDDPAAADEFRTLDRIRSDAGTVGVALATPAGYPSMRRASFDRAIDTQVARLRRKIEPDPAHPTRIVTIRGLGYKYERA